MKEYRSDLAASKKLPNEVYEAIESLKKAVLKLEDYKSIAWKQFLDGNIVIHIYRKVPHVVEMSKSQEEKVLQRLLDSVK